MKNLKLPKTDRRDFLKTTGHLLIGFNLFPFISCNSTSEESNVQAPTTIPLRPNNGNEMLDSWIRLDVSGQVTIMTGKQELGQGIRIALIQIAAEELDVDIASCQIIDGDTGQTPNEGYTAGSNSVEGSGRAIREAAAEARYQLLNLASQKWNLSVSELTVENGYIKNKNQESISYWELLDGKFLEGKVTGQAPIKDPKIHRIVGRSLHRPDIEKLVRGGAHFVHDIRLPNILHARVMHPPTYNAKLSKIDPQSILVLPGILELVVDGSFVAVIAEREYQAVIALRKLKEETEWTFPKIATVPENLYRQMKTNANSPEMVKESPGIGSKINASAKKLEAEYHRPYHMHGTAGPSCALAEWKDGQLTVWSPTQGVYPLRNSLSDLLGLDIEKIRCIGMPGSGCYGHNGADDASAEAALIAMRFPDKSVRLQWTREDEHQWEPFGSAMAIKLAAGLDAYGKITAWDTHLWSDTHNTRPNGKGGHYISGRHLEQPFQFEKGRFSEGTYRNATPYYNIPFKRLQINNYDGPLRTSALRGLGAYGNIFALESFIDELAVIAKIDPFDFRLKNLDDKRAIDVLTLLKEKTGWESRNKNGSIGYGIAFAKYKNSASYFAVLAEVNIDSSAETFKLTKLTGVIDSGQVINPDGLINQTEGGMIQSASWTLLEEVMFDENGVQSKDWSSYPIMRFNDTPEVEVHIINRQEEKPLGAGEAAQGPVAAAIANAIFDGTGQRLRQLPLKPEKIDWKKV
ncbi:molybdopterin-dependent oxidoreductase [Aquiflexum sp. LQ15W]|uniref:xanthine dehydrogenase family protein molybdopterin-binding subunit n=1 Tax=Cognataquiflexum nitidum TaxID=2922272 RepID=UPI001F135356|nr:molybdopterin cofactor-binding domain-containing protein [Cognataquiflexum nitidum]MCH6200390.1 molybdopterin-dependent oxidoreductase [Cognataquiflexum nitidum]